MSLTYRYLNNISNNFGDSFYLLNSEKFGKNFDEFLSLFSAIYPKTNIGYSYKTNYTPALCKIVDEKNGYAEVVSDMEYALAIKIGVNPKKIIVNGPCKTKENLEKFLLSGSIVNLDSHSEILLVKEISRQHPSRLFSVGLRCNFKINNSLISRFGFDVESDDFDGIFDEISNIKNVRLEGIHCHFPNRDLGSYECRINKIIDLSKTLFKAPPKYIDIGGGFFGKMRDSLKSQFNIPTVEYDEYASLIATKFQEEYKEYSYEEKPMLLLEPGSAIVADTMCFVAKVIDIKNIRGRNIATSTGSKFNMGLLTSKVNMPMSVYSSNPSRKYFEKIDVVGFTCIESDCLYSEYSGNVGVGDYVVFENIGSYSIVFKPQFIMPNVPVIECSQNFEEYKVRKRQETAEDVFSTFVF